MNEYISPERAAKWDIAAAGMDHLESLVVAALRPFGIRRMGRDGIQSRYLTVGDNRGTWTIKIRASDHANQSRQHDSADVNLVVGYDDSRSVESIYREIVDAIHAAN